MATAAPILLVEDNETDALFFRRAAEQTAGLPPLRHVTDGAQAIDYLGGTGPFANREEHPFPILVLLDLKLPKKTGFDVLEWAKQQKIRLPNIIVLSSSTIPEDVQRAYTLGAAGYLEKPVSLGPLKRIVAALATLCKEPGLPVSSVLSWYIKPFPQ